MASAKRYPVLSPLRHEGTRYDEGSTVSMDPEIAEPLQESGVLGELMEVDATDAARALAEEEDVSLADVDGSGDDGRVLKSDVKALVDDA
jgi:pyruvate/2-oxoglutarate dehydrogenase complex dihydrolipoamide acyltransferase (E2) component